MSYYYKYQFTSPEPIFSIIKEDMKSYFDTGAIDDLMFPTYLGKCLDKLGKGTYVIAEEILFIEDFEARLPDNFHAVREAWFCIEIPLRNYQTARSFYSNNLMNIVQLKPLIVNGEEVCSCTQQSDCQCEVCNPCEDSCCNVDPAVYKVNHEISRSFRQAFLLKPGNISCYKNNTADYTNAWEFYNSNTINKGNVPAASSYDSFDIHDNKFITNFRTGTVHMIYYAEEVDATGYQLIPDNYRIKEYIEAFIKYKMFELLSNQVTDETFNQLQQKLVFYKQQSDEAYIMAEMEIKKQDAYAKQRRIRAMLNSFNMYQLPGRSNTARWRRNGT